MNSGNEPDTNGRNEAQELVARAEAYIRQKEWSRAQACWNDLLVNSGEISAEIVCRYSDAYVHAYEFDIAREIVQLHLSYPTGRASARRQLSLIDSAQAKKYILRVTRNNNDNTFKIDHILGKPFARPADFAQCSIRGWAKIPDGKEAFLLVETPNEQLHVPFNMVRNDVRAYFLKREQSVHANCGYLHKIDLRWGAKLAVVVDGQIAYKAEIHLEQAAEVLEGKDGWLFLDNDSNQSREQFTGKVVLTTADQEAWECFSHDLACLDNSYPTVFLIANSKERVVPEHYPCSESSRSIADHVAEILTAANSRCVDPRLALKRNIGSFYKTDTHWSDLGAYIAYQETLHALGYSTCALPGITFAEDDAVGDLGSKLDPPVVSKRLRHVYKHPCAIRRVFDNALSTTGRVQVFLNDAPRYDQTAMLFGGSSSAAGSFYKYFAYLFRRVVLINMPGSVIMSMIQYERPDLIVIQTNERYLRAPGKVYPDICMTSVPNSLRSLAANKKIIVRAALDASEEDFYKQMFLSLM